MEISSQPGRARLVALRADQCRRALRQAPGWVRMAIGADDSGGVVVATTDRSSMLRPGVGLGEGERVIGTSAHPELAVARVLRGDGAVLASTSPIPVAVAGRVRALGVAAVAAGPSPGPAPPLRHRLTVLGDEICQALGQLDADAREATLRLLMAVAMATTAAGETPASAAGLDRALARFEESARHGDAGAFVAARALHLSRCHAGAGPGGMADALYEAAFAFGGVGELLGVLSARVAG